MINDTENLRQDFQGWLLFFVLLVVGAWIVSTFESGVGYWVGVALMLAALPVGLCLENIKTLFKQPRRRSTDDG